MTVHRIHNPTHAVVPHSITKQGFSLEALGLFLFVQCQRGAVSSSQLARQFRTTETEINRILAELDAHSVIDVMERAS